MNVVRVDDVLRLERDEQVSVMSIDVQGFEYQVLQGSTRTLRQIKAIIFEASACHEGMGRIMRLLNKDFAMFDFVPVGRLSNATERGYKKRENFLLDFERPGGFGEYSNWLCAFQKQGGYFMVQTDIVAVRRDLVLSLAPMMANISEWACGERKGMQRPCILREWMKDKQ